MKPIGLYPVQDLSDAQLHEELDIFRDDAELYLSSSTPIEGGRRGVIQRYEDLLEEKLRRT